MLHVAILTLALVSGECPDCQRPGASPGLRNTPNRPGATDLPMAAALVPPPPVLRYPSIFYMLPCACAGCVGQNCFSITRPYLPGVPVYNYRRDFNYPWSQEPCWMPPPAAAFDGPSEPGVGPEEVPLPPLAARRKSKPKATVVAGRNGALVSDQVQKVARRPAQSRAAAKR
jgi:hypothetical protein